MVSQSKIEWTGPTWNPVRGCSRKSPGCENCYAEKMAHRFKGPGFWGQGLTVLGSNGPRWKGVLREVPEKLDEPLRWRDPQLVFVNSMSDLFHEKIDDEYVEAVFGIMAACPQHTFQVLTKRAVRMRTFIGGVESLVAARHKCTVGSYLLGKAYQRTHKISTPHRRNKILTATPPPWPLPNVWLGVSVEDVKRKDRIDALRQTPAAVRFLSCEPLLEDLGELDLTGIDWVIVGGESGPRSRPMELAWARRIVEQCRAAGVHVFVKQLGRVWSDEALSKDLKGGRMRDWPKDLQVREMPMVSSLHA